MIVSARLRSAALIATLMTTALAFYMVSLRVAAERSAVEKLQDRIATNMLEVRQLQSELGTRERLPQLEKWNTEVLALSAPKAGQYLDNTVELAAFANDRAGVGQPQLQPAIATKAEAPKTNAVRTVAYAANTQPAAAQPKAQPRQQPVVTFAAERDDSNDQPLLQTASYHPKPQRAAPVSASAGTSVLSASVMSEIREAAAAEASGLRQARVR